ncbi:MAG: alanine racemase [Candidatus Eisenbacteria bacterium]|nr:alanine racemase [Candidatus Eisenbacteria bacterium]
MNRLTIDIEALRHNYNAISNWVRGHGAGLTVVTKALCGHTETISALRDIGVDSMADSRLENLRVIRRAAPGAETWYLRPPHVSALAEVVQIADVSLNTELEIIKKLNEEAVKQNKVHKVIVMIELGDLREGILPGALLNVYKQVFQLPNIRVLGIGANLGCMGGVIPSVDQYMQLVLYRELLELKFERDLPMISAGSSATIPMLLEGRLPEKINHFRVGESLFLGTDVIQGETAEGLRDDAVRLEAEIVEIKEKGMVPLGETTDITPFQPLEVEESYDPGERGYRAIVTVGQVDTDVGGLIPLGPDHQIAGASSDLTVVNVGDEKGGLSVGDTLAFRLSYSSFVRLMANPYTVKRVVGNNGPRRTASSASQD